MADVIAIGAESDCKNPGGVLHVYGTDFANITAVTVASGVITGFTMGSTGQWAKLEPDDEDDVAFFNEEGELAGNNVNMNGTGFLKFNKPTAAKIDAADKIKDCCGVVLIWVLNDGTRLVEGIDIDYTDDSWAFSKTKPRVIPNRLSDTGANSSRLEYNVQHVGKALSRTTTLTDSAIEAL